MKKQILSILMALSLCLTLLPATAWAAGTTYTYTSWDDVPSTPSIKLNDGDTLDLSGITSIPADSDFKYVYVVSGKATVIGNPDVSMPLAIDVGTSYSTADAADSSTLVMQNLNTSETIYPYSTDTTIEYSGTNTLSGSLGIYPGTAKTDENNRVKLSLKGETGATLNISSSISYTRGLENISKDYPIDLTLEGGSVTTSSIGLTSGSITVKNCSLAIQSESVPGLSIYFSQCNTENFANSTISIESSTVKVKSEGTKNTAYYGRVGIGGYSNGFSNKIIQSISIKDSTVEMEGYSVTSSNNSNICSAPAIGHAKEIVIDNSTVTATAQVQERSALIGQYSAGIGGMYESITIKNGSTVTAVGYMGAGIGGMAQGDNPSITIEDSTVNAASTYGAGIGSSRGSGMSAGVTISGDSKVTAVSQYGAGIGSGTTGTYNKPSGVPLEIGSSSSIDKWGDGADAESSVILSAAAAESEISASSLLYAARASTSSLITASGTLTILADGNDVPAVYAESGAEAVNMTVAADTPMMQYTLDDDSDVPAVTTPINRAAEDGETDDGPGAPSYDLRPGFRSLAFWPVAVGTYSLSYGSGSDPDPLLDVNKDYSATYTLTTPGTGGNALNVFSVVRQQKLTGSVTLVDGSNTAIEGSTTVNTTLHPDLSGVAPSVTGNSQYLTYQWYQDGNAIENATGATYTPSTPGVYFCAVTGTGLYRGTINSQAVTVVESSATAPSAPTAQTITAQSITLENASEGETAYEYGLVTSKSITWQDSPTFTGLTRNTEYSFVQREKAAEGEEPGATSAAASFTTKPGKPSANDLQINYEKETATVTTGVTLYTDEECTNKIALDVNSSITSYIGQTVYAKYDDVEIEDNTYEVVTAVEIPARPAAPELTADMITASDTSLSLESRSGVTYALFSAGNTENPTKTIEGTGSTITFDSLTASTTYVIKARTEATSTSFHSLQARVEIATSAPLVRIGVTPTKTSYPYTGNEQTFQYTTNPANVESLTVTYYDSDWGKLDSAPTALGTYHVKITRTADNTYAAVEATFTMEITQGEQDSPNAPQSVSQTTTSVSVTVQTETNEDRAIEYCCVYGTVTTLPENVSWQSSSEFTGLQPGTAYTFFARYAAYGNYAASPASGGTTISTLPNTPTAGTVTINYQKETLTFNENYEVSTAQDFTTGIISSGASISSIIANTDQTLYVRVKADGNISASDAQSFTIPARPAAPSGFTVDTSTESVTIPSGYYYNTISGDYANTSWQQGDSSTVTVTPNSSIYIYKPAVTEGENKAFKSAVQTLTAPTRGTTPNVGINYEAEKLSTSTAMEYKVGDSGTWADCSASMDAIAFGNWDGSTAVTVYFRAKATTDAYASDAQTVIIPARPAAPTGLQGVNETVDGNHDGKITGVTTAMEYKLSTAESWTKCTGTEVTGLAPGKYQVRLAATSSDFASAAADVTIATGAARTYTLNVTAPTFDAAAYGTQPDAQAITISNSGNSASAISGVALSGNTSAFTLNKTDGATVQPGQSDTSYTIQPAAGLGAGTYTATITVTYQGGETATATASFTVTQAAQEAPAAPQLDSQTTNSITLKTADPSANGAAAEYGISTDGGTTWVWQASPEFTKLSSGKEYTFAVRYSATEDGNYAASPASVTAAFSTARPSYPTALTYPPTVEDADNGTVSVTPASPRQGGTVTVTPSPDKGYEVDSITITDQNGNPVKVTDNGDGTWSFTQPAGKVTISVAYVCDGQTETCASYHFDDVNTTVWYHLAVDYVVENGLMNGYDNGLFGPNDNLSRAMLAQILYNREERPAVTGDSAFGDVADSAWYADAILWASQNGIAEGYNGLFAPNDPITREQLAVMLWRYAGCPAAARKELNFTDADRVSPWAREAMLWATENGIINGFDGVLDPRGKATRAETAQLLKNFLENA